MNQNFLKRCIYFITFSQVIFCFPIFFTLYGMLNGWPQRGAYPAVIDFIILLFIESIFYLIKKIIRNVLNHEIFIQENITRFKSIAYLFFIAAIGTLFSPVGIIAFDQGSMVKGETLLFAIIGFLILMIGHIFDYAMNLQQEATELKEEIKLTI